MKQTVTNQPRQTHVRRYRRPYPNAADPSYFANKLVDGILAVATGMGTVTILFYLMTI